MKNKPVKSSFLPWTLAQVSFDMASPLLFNFFIEAISINCEIFSDKDEALLRSSHSAQIDGEYMYVFGGLVSEDEEALNELWKLDLSM